jgi:hypothetical protein
MTTTTVAPPEDGATSSTALEAARDALRARLRLADEAAVRCATARPQYSETSSTLASIVESERFFLRGFLADAAPAGAFRAIDFGRLWPTRWHGPGHSVLAAAVRDHLAPGVEPPTFEELVEYLHDAGAAEAEAALRQLPPSPIAPADVAGHLHYLLEQGDPATSNVGAEQPSRVLDVSEIFAPLPPVNYLCQALDIAPGAPALVAGYGFSGKTVSIQDFALAVATETLAWGRFPVRRGRVLHIDYEQGSHLTRLRYQRLARARGIDPADLGGRLALAAMPGWYLDGDPHGELERLSEGFDLVIVDSLRAGCPRTDENASDARIPLDRLTRNSERNGNTSIVIHHARKPTKDAPGGARMSIRGSGALYDACGSTLIYSAEKGEPTTVVHDKARISGRTHEDFRLWIEDVAIDGDLTAGLRVTCLAASPSRAEESSSSRLDGLKARLLAHIRDHGPVAGSLSVLQARLNARRADVSAARDELIHDSLIVSGGTTKNPTLAVPGTDRD